MKAGDFELSYFGDRKKSADPILPIPKLEQDIKNFLRPLINLSSGSEFELFTSSSVEFTEKAVKRINFNLKFTLKIQDISHNYAEVDSYLIKEYDCA